MTLDGGQARILPASKDSSPAGTSRNCEDSRRTFDEFKISMIRFIETRRLRIFFGTSMTVSGNP